MNTLWYKIRADLRRYKSRTILAVISIAAGVFCIGTLYGMIDLQLAKMDAAHQRSKPSHISLILNKNAEKSILSEINKIKGVAQIDIMTPVSIRYKLPGHSEWKIGTLMFRPDYSAQKFDLTTLEAGKWPSENGIAVERLSAEIGNLSIGENIQFETFDNASMAFKIDGIVRHPFVKPPRFGGQLHFFADPSLTHFFGIPKETFRQVLVQITPPYRPQKAQFVAEEIRGVLNDHSIGVNVTLLQEPTKHWGRPFFAGINIVLQLMALASLALASVLIFNTVSAHISQQINQIGVMKALGGKTVTIAKVYLAEAALTALLAILFALPLSLVAAHLSSCRLLDFFNIDCGPFAMSTKAVILMVVGGLLAPTLAALGPILWGASMTVRSALAGYQSTSTFGAGRMDRWLERFSDSLLPTLYAAAWGNLFRNKWRLVLTQSVLIIAGVLFLNLMSLAASVNLTLANEMARSCYDVRLGFRGDQIKHKVVELALQVPGVESVETWQRLPVALLKNGQGLRQKGSLGLQLMAVPAATESYRPLIEHGRWLQGSDRGEHSLVLSADTAELNDIKVGDTVFVRLGRLEQEWHVIGLYRWLAGSGYTVEPVYAPLEAVTAITGRHDLASLAMIKASITTLGQEQSLVNALDQKFSANGIPLDVYTTLSKLVERQHAVSQFEPVLSTLLGLAAMIAGVGGVGLSGTLAIGVLHRIREIGMLRAIGAPARAIFRQYLLEGLFHGLLAWSLSIPIAFYTAEPIAHLLGKTMLGIKLDYTFDWVGTGYWLGIILILSWLAAYWPARKASRLSVNECLTH